MIKYIGNNNITSINYQGAEIKKLFLGNNIYYWNLPSNDIPIYPWEEYSVQIENYQLDLMNQWRLSTTLQDLDTNYITYESFSNWNVNNGYANMKVIIPQGVQSLTIHYGSYAESSFDYMMIFKLDQEISLTTNYTATNAFVQVHSSSQQSAQAPNLSYTFNITDTSIEHFFYVQYRKDGSVNSDQDRGYISFNKNDKRQFDGFRKIFHTYNEQEISPYIYQFYDAQHYGYSTDKETILYYDPITATTDVLEYQLVDGEEEDTFNYNRHIWTKKYYNVKLKSGEIVTTDYYTFGEDKGEIQGLPISDFNFNFNFKQYIPETQTVPNDTNANWHQDLVLQGTPSVSNGSITVTASNAYAQFPFETTSDNIFNRDSTNPDMTIIYKIGNTSGVDLISNRGYCTTSTSGAYNWMIRAKGTSAVIHYASETASVSYTQDAVKTLVLTNNAGQTTHKVIGGGVGTSTNGYGNASGRICFFVANYSATSPTYKSETFSGTVYWMFQANRVLSEEEINQVIQYNESL